MEIKTILLVLSWFSAAFAMDNDQPLQRKKLIKFSQLSGRVVLNEKTLHCNVIYNASDDTYKGTYQESGKSIPFKPSTAKLVHNVLSIYARFKK